jgi:hypothetical protein
MYDRAARLAYVANPYVRKHDGNAMIVRAIRLDSHLQMQPHGDMIDGR